mmetsp:Transcript_28379/g.72921  ORF Transcript_28379/g.72921 Transcript_28379/m.72921 type:complete len:98 (+) Transcript_28379:332-625(+)
MLVFEDVEKEIVRRGARDPPRPRRLEAQIALGLLDKGALTVRVSPPVEPGWPYWSARRSARDAATSSMVGRRLGSCSVQRSTSIIKAGLVVGGSGGR